MGEWIEIELVEEPARQRRVAVEPTEPSAPRVPPRLDGRNRRIVVLAAGAVVVAGIGWAVSRSDTEVSTDATATTLHESAGSSPSPEPTGVATTQPDRPSTTRPRSTTTTGPPLKVTNLGGPLLPTASGIELVGLTVQGELVDIDLDTGQMTTTDLPGAWSGAPATIVAGQGWAYVQRWDVNSSFLVLRGQPPADITSSSMRPSSIYRGPEPDTMWAAVPDPVSGAIPELDLLNLDGEPIGRSIDMQGWWAMQSDLEGGVVVQAGGGVYVVSEAGAQRVADGELVGVGLNHFLVRACDEVLACGLFVVDRLSGERRQVPVIRVDGLAQYYGWASTDSTSVAPDGSAAILFGLDGSGSGAALLGTDSGVYRTLTQMTDTFSVAWSDDSRYIAFADNRTLRVYDRITGLITDFDDAVPQLVNFSSRP